MIRDCITTLFVMFVVLIIVNIVTFYNIFLFQFNIVVYVYLPLFILTYLVSPLIICYSIINNLTLLKIKQFITYSLIISVITLLFNYNFSSNFIFLSMINLLSTTGLNLYFDIITYTLYQNRYDNINRSSEMIVFENVNPVFDICSEYHISKYDKKCSICLENIKSDNNVVLNCNHCFHQECIKKWYNIKNTCPNCRTMIV